VEKDKEAVIHRFYQRLSAFEQMWLARIITHTVGEPRALYLFWFGYIAWMVGRATSSFAMIHGLVIYYEHTLTW
jgi:hypothetical protein